MSQGVPLPVIDQIIKWLNDRETKPPWYKMLFKHKSDKVKVSKYVPHQGKKEMAKRAARMAQPRD